jgi:hypothetical protein
MAPSIEGDVHMFAEHGLYDGLFLMRDEETGTFWDHMTGRAVYGPLVGETLEIEGLRQTTVEQALETDPDAVVALSEQALRQDDQLQVDGLLAGIGRRLSEMFQSTVEEEDDRRPTMDLGIGIWSDNGARYYPHDVVRAEGRAIVDVFNGRQVLIFLDPRTFILSAVHVEGNDPRWDDDVVRLSDGSYVEGGLLYDSSGNRTASDVPLQVFTRWYGFSLTFPDTEIYGAAN